MLGELFACFLLALHGARQLVAGIADRLQLADFAHHLAYLLLGFVAQVVVAHLLQVAGYLYLDLVGGVFLVLYLAETLVAIHRLDIGLSLEQALVGLNEQLAHHAEHLADALGKGGSLLLCLQH